MTRQYKGPHDPLPYDGGYVAMSTAGLTTDIAILDSDEQAGTRSCADVQRWPDALILRTCLRVVALPADCQKIKAAYISNGYAYAPTPFYPSTFSEGSSQYCQSVICQYAGSGMARQGESLLPLTDIASDGITLEIQPTLFQKLFSYQTHSTVLVQEESREGGHWHVATHRRPEGLLDHMPVFAYGGVVDPTQDLERLMQAYAVVTSGGNYATQVTVKSRLFYQGIGLVEQGSVASMGSRLCYFHDQPMPQEAYSLGHNLRHGAIKVLAQGDAAEMLYQSYAYAPITDEPGCWDIYLQPGS